MPVPLQFSNFIDVFMYLNSLKKHLIVVIDEYPYLKSETDSKHIDSVFQNIIDNTDDIRLILSGSHVSMMKELPREKNALYGRFQTVIRLKELSYLEAGAFCSDLTPYDKVSFYAVFGGSPYVLSQLDYNKSLETNIEQYLLNQNSPIYL